MSSVMLNISTFLLIVACGAWISMTLKKPLRWLAVMCLIVLSLILPAAGSNPWLWINGAAGELSIVTLILLAVFILRSLAGINLLSFQTRRHLYFLLLLAGFMLYPATLGLTRFDPYILGFGLELTLLLLMLSVMYWFFQQRQLALIFLIVVAADEAGTLSSLNTWDYLIDPLLWLFTPALLLIMFIDRRERAKAGS